ncbi:hypothetical protein BW247_09280 [Acidihalobacter ferrooxydans]|uniref:Sigma-54 factor interaction domain-containing protein n=2 Tax=Acidihalobacter ferrooxydans TaxID=1765967 RepID=A0A1P8UHK6_9GAMM|nr:hypothetical protein BW247_09280 [Acidihalobacter ferrooxydans]
MRGPTIKTHTDIESARRQFFEHGRMPSPSVSNVIAQSWLRCADRLDPDARPPIEITEWKTLEHRRDLHAELRRAALPELDALAELLRGSESLVLLADTEGLILDTVGNTDFLDKTARIALQPGAIWSEAQRGTNAIGTTLAEERAVEVLGREHFLECNEILNCHAAPILNTRGEICAVMDVSSNSRLNNLHALGMVRMAIRIVEHRLTYTVPADCRVLRLHQQAQLLGSYREGVLILRDEHIVGANRTAVQLLHTHWQELLDTPLEQWLETGGDPRASIARTLDGRQLHTARQCTPSPKPRPRAPAINDGFIDDPSTSVQLEQAVAVLNAGIAVLVCGETGTGKEVFARRLHARSHRRSGPFVAINCAALPETLIESELFGYTDGAFTGARRKGALGRIREADGGVLFLDEIGDMPLALQARLLRVLQDRTVIPLGCGTPVTVDFDLICATNRRLEPLSAAGRFRKDLYYRIQGYNVRLSALRERHDRIAFILSLFEHLDTSNRQLSPQTLQYLAAHPWPGNLRQLTNALRTLIALTPPGSTIEVETLPDDLLGDSSDCMAFPPLLGGDLRALNRAAIERALEMANGSVSKAARQLGVHRSTLYRRLRDPAGNKPHCQ